MEFSNIHVGDDLALLSVTGGRVVDSMSPRQALELAESLTRSAFRRMMIEEAMLPCSNYESRGVAQ